MGSQFERKHCSSSGSSDNESPTPPSSAFNHLDESSNYSTITPSPEGFPMYSDPCMNLGHSPAATSSSSHESPAPNTYNIGSVSSNYTGSDPDSDSDNCNPQKMRYLLRTRILISSQKFSITIQPSKLSWLTTYK